MGCWPPAQLRSCRRWHVSAAGARQTRDAQALRASLRLVHMRAEGRRLVRDDGEVVAAKPALVEDGCERLPRCVAGPEPCAAQARADLQHLHAREQRRATLKLRARRWRRHRCCCRQSSWRGLPFCWARGWSHCVAHGGKYRGAQHARPRNIKRAACHKQLGAPILLCLQLFDPRRFAHSLPAY